MAPVAETKASQLMDEIIARSSQAVDAFTLHRWKSEAEKLLPIHPAEASGLLGAIATFEFDIPQVRKWHDNSVKLSPTAIKYKNYSTSLERVHLYAEAIEIGQIAYEMDESDPALLKDYIGHCVQGGCYHLATDLLKKYRKMVPEIKNGWETSVPKAARFFTESGIEDKDTSGMIRIIGDILRENKIACVEMALELQYDESSRWVSKRYFLNASEDEVYDLESQLMNTVVDNGLASLYGKMTCRFLPPPDSDADIV